MEQVERWLIAEALRDHGNNKTQHRCDPRDHARGAAQEAREVRGLMGAGERKQAQVMRAFMRDDPARFRE